MAMHARILVWFGRVALVTSPGFGFLPSQASFSQLPGSSRQVASVVAVFPPPTSPSLPSPPSTNHFAWPSTCTARASFRPVDVRSARPKVRRNRRSPFESLELLSITMGNFLAAPITDKETETGEGNGLVYGVSAMQGWRTNMEDSHVAVVDSASFPAGVSVFAVCDGHGGKLAADMAAAAMADVFGETMKKRALFPAGSSAQTGEGMPTPEAIGACLREAFMLLDARIKEAPEVQYGSDQSGCTAIASFITSSHIIVANSGDSRSVLGKTARTVPMSFDHKPMNDIERRRIERAGGMVRANRVNGDLAVSRALGDFTYKQRNDLPAEEQQVSAEPDIKIEPRDGTEEFLIIACDGIWDVMSNDDACNHVRMLMGKGEKDMGLIAEDIIDTCLKLGSRDNMSAIVIQFPGARFGTGEGVAGIRRERASVEAQALKEQEANNSQAVQS